MNRVRTPNIFTDNEEKGFVNCIISMTDFGFPFGLNKLLLKII